MPMRRLLLPLSVLVAAALALAVSGGHDTTAARPVSEVVVQLTAPALAYDHSARARARIATQQRRFVDALHAAVPGAGVRWRYRIVANGLAVSLPRHEVRRLGGLPGVKRVYTGGSTYRALAGPDAATIGVLASKEK